MQPEWSAIELLCLDGYQHSAICLVLPFWALINGLFSEGQAAWPRSHADVHPAPVCICYENTRLVDVFSSSS